MVCGSSLAGGGGGAAGGGGGAGGAGGAGGGAEGGAGGGGGGEDLCHVRQLRVSPSFDGDGNRAQHRPSCEPNNGCLITWLQDP